MQSSGSLPFTLLAAHDPSFTARVAEKGTALFSSESAAALAESDIMTAKDERNGRARRTNMVTLTPVATDKVREIMTQQNPVPAGLRVAVVGGGCSGFTYHMAFENQANESDNVYEFGDLKVMVDQMSEMYLDGVEIDYVESLEGAGFKFNNPNVRSTCGCGASFSA